MNGKGGVPRCAPPRRIRQLAQQRHLFAKHAFNMAGNQPSRKLPFAKQGRTDQPMKILTIRNPATCELGVTNRLASPDAACLPPPLARMNPAEFASRNPLAFTFSTRLGSHLQLFVSRCACRRPRDDTDGSSSIDSEWGWAVTAWRPNGLPAACPSVTIDVVSVRCLVLMNWFRQRSFPFQAIPFCGYY